MMYSLSELLVKAYFIASITEVFPVPLVPVISILLPSSSVSDMPNKFFITTLVIFIS